MSVRKRGLYGHPAHAGMRDQVHMAFAGWSTPVARETRVKGRLSDAG